MMELKNQAIWINVIMSIVAFYLTTNIIPQMRSMFIKANLFGIDLCKKDRNKKIPESQGVIAGCVYLIILFCLIPIQFSQFKSSSTITDGHDHHFFNQESNLFNHYIFVQFLAGLLSICCMLFLGFADDVLNLRWRVKLFLPTLASLPLLIVYALTYDNTTIIVPKPLRSLLGFSIDLSLLYYVYLSLLAVFCTNAINILAGINGIEAGQSLLICLSIIVYNLTELIRATDHWYSHIFSLNMMLPFLAVTMAILIHNWYPATIFVGDTYCYFAGMTFAVVGILGHFSKTMLLFFMPQIFNFLYSCPQLFHFVPCPRHRLPKYNSDDNKMYPSLFTYKKEEIGFLGNLMIKILQIFKLIQWKKIDSDDGNRDGDSDSDSDGKTSVIYQCSNLTIINLVLVLFGPMEERKLTIVLLLIQFISTLIAFSIRYGLSEIFY